MADAPETLSRPTSSWMSTESLAEYRDTIDCLDFKHLFISDAAIFDHLAFYDCDQNNLRDLEPFVRGSGRAPELGRLAFHQGKPDARLTVEILRK
jgi:hypothetical protein